MKYKFFIRMDGVIYGPYSLQEYHDLDVPGDTEVMEEGVGEWYYASDFPSYEELNARENSYKLMPDGSIEKIKEEKISPNFVKTRTLTNSKKTSDSLQNQNRGTSNPSMYVPTGRTMVVDGQSDKPNEGWNWGAFVFNWLWGIFNGMFWPLIIIPIAIIPRIGVPLSFGICILLGIKGNEWAWRARAWDCAEHFNNVQHRWAVAAGIYCLIVFVFIIVGVTDRWNS